MRIAIFGYYNKLNFGDDRLHYCLNLMLSKHNCDFFRHYEDFDIRNFKKYDYILIGGGGLVWDPVGVWKNGNWSKLPVRLGVIGLGVNNVSNTQVSGTLEKYIENAEFFFVRDRKSKALLNNNSSVKVYPDLSWLYPFNEESPNNNQIEFDFALNLVQKISSPFDMQLIADAMEDQNYVLMPFKYDGTDLREMQRLGLNSKTRFQTFVEPLIRSRFYIGCRFHGVVFSVQMLKPFVAIGYDDKVHRFLEDNDLMDMYCGLDDLNLLKEKIEYIRSNTESIIDRLRAARERNIAMASKLKNEVHSLMGMRMSGTLASKIRKKLFVKFGV